MKKKYPFTHKDKDTKVEILKSVKEDIIKNNLIRFNNDNKKYFQNLR